MTTKINIENGKVISVIVDGVTAWSTVPPRLRPPRSYFEICYAAGWGGEFSSYEDALIENWEGRSIREVLPTDEHYIPRWFPTPVTEQIIV
jgi:hypothetical protein